MSNISLLNDGDTGLQARTIINALVNQVNTSGVSGTSGTSGVDGTSGTSGESGTSGTSGINGTSGTSGVDGTNGTSGTSGESGTSGTSGTTGQGVPTGGTSGQILSKIDSTDYNTEWIDAPSGGSVSNNISIDTLSYNDGTLGTAGAVGEIAYFGGGTGLTPGNLVHFSNGTWVNADADATTTSTGLLGISIGTAGTSGVLLRGYARFTGNANYTAMTTVGAQVYVSLTTGAFTQNMPGGSGKVIRIIGYVASATQDKLYFCPDTMWIQL